MSKETQWAALKQLGFSDKACAVVMGHAEAESGCECDRVQGDFTAGRTKSKAYTAQVDAGNITEHEFIYSSPGGGGYGWLQWTFPARKEGLYDTAKGLGVSIGSEQAAIEWFWNEIHQPEYALVWKALNSDMSIRGMSDVFMKHFERPADQGEGACAHRAKLCEKMLEQFGSTYVPPIKNPVSATFPPDPSIWALQLIMQKNGFWDGEVTGRYSEKFIRAYLDFGEGMRKTWTGK